MLASGTRYNELREMFPSAHILGCSTGGQINNNDVSDDELVAAAIGFDSTRLRLFRQDIADAQQSRSCGETIGRALSREDLAGVFVLSDGLNVNGSELVNGLVAAIGPGIPITRCDWTGYSDHWRTGWRRRRLCGNACRRRLHSTSTHCGRYRILRQRH
jgi:FIST-like protein